MRPRAVGSQRAGVETQRSSARPVRGSAPRHPLSSRPLSASPLRSLPRLSVCFSLLQSLSPSICCLALFLSNLSSLFSLCLLLRRSFPLSLSQPLSHCLSLSISVPVSLSGLPVTQVLIFISYSSLCLLPSLSTQYLYQSHLSQPLSLCSYLCLIISVCPHLSLIVSLSHLHFSFRISPVIVSLSDLACSLSLSPLLSSLFLGPCHPL